MAGAAGVLMLLAGATVVSASVPNTDGTISGCINDATGVVRIIDTAKPGALGRCISAGILRETPVTWNSTGPVGPPGRPAPSPAIEIILMPITTVDVAPGEFGVISAPCPPETVPIGRDFFADGDYSVTTDAAGHQMWTVIARNNSNFPGSIVLAAKCIDLVP